MHEVQLIDTRCPPASSGCNASATISAECTTLGLLRLKYVRPSATKTRLLRTAVIAFHSARQLAELETIKTHAAAAVCSIAPCKAAACDSANISPAACAGWQHGIAYTTAGLITWRVEVLRLRQVLGAALQVEACSGKK